MSSDPPVQSQTAVKPPQQPQIAQPLKKISIKQFEWYEVQTKVRQLLTELLQPFTKKQTQDTVKMNEFKRNLGSMQKKLQDHDFLLTQQNAEKPTYVQLQDDKIAAIQQKMVAMQLQQNRKINQMQQTIQIYSLKINQLNQLQNRLQNEVKERTEQLSQHKEYLDKQVDLMLKKLDNQDGQINTLRQTTRNTVTKLETRTVVVENRATALEDEMKRKGQQIKRTIDQITNMNQKLAAVDLHAKDLDLRLHQREKDYKLSQKFMARSVQLQNSVSFIENYLRFYQPLYTQMQISQTMNSYLKGTNKTRLCLFEQKLYAQMHFSILNMQQDTLQARMGDYSNRIRRIINRNKKYLIRMKVQQTLKYGNNTYQLRQIDQSMLQKSQQSEHTTKPPQIIIPQQQINKLIEQKWQKMLSNIDERIRDRTDPFKVWMKEIQEQAILKEIQLEKKMGQLRNKSERVQVGVELFKSEVGEIQKEMKVGMDFVNKEVRKNKEQIKDIVNFSSVINHIVIQDQIDRQGLALYALKSGTNTGSGQKSQPIYDQSYPNIHLDQKCVACQNGNASMIVNQAFKMACLAYNPSQIKVDDRVFSREQILEISTNILDKLKKKFEQTQQKKQQSTLFPLNLTAANTSKAPESKTRSKSLLSRQLNTSKNMETLNINTNNANYSMNSSTIDIPGSSRLRDTTYLLPVLGQTRKKSSMGSHRDKINI